MSEFKLGDLVQLSPESVKNFYGHPKRLESFDSSNSKTDYWENDDFLEFFNKYLGFESGELGGFVYSISETAVRVKFFGPLGWQNGFYDEENLVRIKETK